MCHCVCVGGGGGVGIISGLFCSVFFFRFPKKNFIPLGCDKVCQKSLKQM